MPGGQRGPSDFLDDLRRSVYTTRNMPRRSKHSPVNTSDEAHHILGRILHIGEEMVRLATERSELILQLNESLDPTVIPVNRRLPPIEAREISSAVRHKSVLPDRQPSPESVAGKLLAVFRKNPKKQFKAVDLRRSVDSSSDAISSRLSDLYNTGYLIRVAPATYQLASNIQPNRKPNGAKKRGPSAEDEFHPSGKKKTTADKILDALAQASNPLPFDAIHEHVGGKINTVRKTVYEMLAAGRVERAGRGQYCAKATAQPPATP